MIPRKDNSGLPSRAYPADLRLSEAYWPPMTESVVVRCPVVLLTESTRQVSPAYALAPLDASFEETFL